MIEVKVYKTEHGVEPFYNFLSNIKDPKAKSAVAKEVTKIEKGLPGTIRSVGNGVKERKIYVGAGYRIYFYNDGQELIILLGGSSKKDQEQEIENAKNYLGDYKRQKKALKKMNKI